MFKVVLLLPNIGLVFDAQIIVYYLRFVGFMPGIFTLPVDQTGLVSCNIKKNSVDLRENVSIF